MKTIAHTAVSTRARPTFSLQKGAPSPVPHPPVVWSVAGSDSGGGAGLQADLKAFQAFGVHGCTAVAAITAQNSRGVQQWQAVAPELLDAQLRALAADMPPAAIKTGMLGSVDNVRVLCTWVDALRAGGHPVALVVDPVLGASTGAAFADAALLDAYRQQLLPRATVLTPNRAEAARLLGHAALDPQDCPHAAQALLHLLGCGTRERGALPALPQAVLITGGDAQEAHAADWLLCREAQGWLGLPRQATPHSHGTGCAFASSLAAALAQGYCVADAAVLAKMATAHALQHGYAAGQGAGPVQALPDFALQPQHLPTLSARTTLPSATAPSSGPASGAGAWASANATAPTAATESSASSVCTPLLSRALGVYAVVDSAAWVQRVFAAGIRTVQLRIKDPATPDLEAQVRQSIAAAAEVSAAQLFINDHWQLALRCGAYGVHLGQEDLESADFAALRSAGVRVGLSTHSYWEVARALALQPSYIACGPLFATSSKDMPWIPQGLDNLRYWAQLLDTPVVGIGGLTLGHMADVAASGAAGAAVISAITQAEDPDAACRELQAAFAAAAWGA